MRCSTATDRTTAKSIALGFGPRKPSVHTLADHLALNSANTPQIWNMARPDRVVVLIACRCR
jgi:hypothetical protein